MPPLPVPNTERNRERALRALKIRKQHSHRPASFIGQDLDILSGAVRLDYDETSGVTMYIAVEEESKAMEESNGRNQNGDSNQDEDADEDMTVDMDEIRALISSDSISDLDAVEQKLKIDGIRRDPFDVETFVTSPQFLCRVLLLPASFRSNHELEITTPFDLLASICRFYDSVFPVAIVRLVRLLCHYQQSTTKRIAWSALQGLREMKHGLNHLPDKVVVTKREWRRKIGTVSTESAKQKISQKVEVERSERKQTEDDDDEKRVDDDFQDNTMEIKRQFADFEKLEERIASRIVLCTLCHRYYDLMDYLLVTPLTPSRLLNAIETCKRYHDRLTDIQNAAIFKRLLSAWIEVKMMEYRNEEIEEMDGSDDDEDEDENENVEIGSDWVIQLRPSGYNGFHFMRHITQEIMRRKEKRIIEVCNDIKNCGNGDDRYEERSAHRKRLDGLLEGDVPILAAKDDIPVSVVRPVLMFFAAELHAHR